MPLFHFILTTTILFCSGSPPRKRTPNHWPIWSLANQPTIKQHTIVSVLSTVKLFDQSDGLCLHQRSTDQSLNSIFVTSCRGLYTKTFYSKLCTTGNPNEGIIISSWCEISHPAPVFFRYFLYFTYVRKLRLDLSPTIHWIWEHGRFCACCLCQGFWLVSRFSLLLVR